MRAYDSSVALSVALELAPTPGAWSGRLLCADTFGHFDPH